MSIWQRHECQGHMLFENLRQRPSHKRVAIQTKNRNASIKSFLGSSVLASLIELLDDSQEMVAR